MHKCSFIRITDLNCFLRESMFLKEENNNFKQFPLFYFSKTIALLHYKTANLIKIKISISIFVQILLKTLYLMTKEK